MKTDIIYDYKNPILLNGWKHHKLFIKAEIKKYHNSKQYDELQNKTQCIGNSRMDIYLGPLLLPDIIMEVINYLKKNNSFRQLDYAEWIGGQISQFREIYLSDGSRWTLLPGNHPDKYIHIHPSRYSKYTARINSSTLKTIILALTIGGSSDISFYTLEFINKIRVDWLNLSPVKVINKSNGLGKYMVEFLNIN